MKKLYRYCLYSIMIILCLFLDRNFNGFGFETGSYFLNKWGILVIDIIILIECILCKKYKMKIILLLLTICVFVYFLYRVYDGKTYIPSNACSSAYACECNDIDKLCKCKYCKEFNNSNECINETYIECDVK